MKTFKVICLFLVILSFAALSFAEQSKRSATVIEVTGNVETRSAQTPWVPAKAGMVLNESDLIRTKMNSSAVIKLVGNAETATVEIKQNSQLMLAELIEDKVKGTQKTLLDLALGEILIKAQKLQSKDSKFEVKTPTSVVGVRGTTFAVSVQALE